MRHFRSTPSFPIVSERFIMRSRGRYFEWARKKRPASRPCPDPKTPASASRGARHGDDQAELPVHPVRPDVCAGPAVLRARGGQGTQAGPARGFGGALRERLLQLPALRAVSLFHAVGPAGVEDRRLRQRRRIPRLGADLRPQLEDPRLPHLPRRQDALRGPRPAARLRGKADHGLLSRPTSPGLPPGTRKPPNMPSRSAAG